MTNPSQKRYVIKHKVEIAKRAKIRYEKKVMLKPWYKFLCYARSRCFSKKHRYYTRGIKIYITEEELKYLWFRDKAWLLHQPSLDRVNGNKNYELDNCRFIELIDNKKMNWGKNDTRKGR